MNWITQALREPFNALSHGAGAVLAAVGFVVLLYEARSLRQYIAMLIFGAALVFLYTSSSLYHGIKGSGSLRKMLHTLDRIAIHALIAGTATPIALLSLWGSIGGVFLTVLWLLAGLGIILTLWPPTQSKVFFTLFYVVVGWVPIVFLRPIMSVLPVSGIVWILAGGLAYTVGAFCYLLEWPEWPRLRIGSHELWHLFCLTGSSAHFVFMVRFVV